MQHSALCNLLLCAIDSSFYGIILLWHHPFMASESSFHEIMLVCLTMESAVYATMFASGQVCINPVDTKSVYVQLVFAVDGAFFRLLLLPSISLILAQLLALEE